MGRDWLYKARNGGDNTLRRGGGGGKKPKHGNSSSSSLGCMGAIYSLLDINQHHHHHLRLHHPSESAINTHSQHSSFCLQGIEAPRNSLESPESAIVDLNIPVGGIQIKTERSNFNDDGCCSSAKTPNLVARLMGLDLLPDAEHYSPRTSSSSAPENSLSRSRSSPVTAGRRSTDNDYKRRLSLQVDDKENCSSTCMGHDQHLKMARRRRSELPVNRKDDKNSSQYVRSTNKSGERISRRMGTDITNTMSPARNKHRRRDSTLVLLKPKNSPAPEKTVKRNINSNFSKPISDAQEIIKIRPQTQKTHKTPLMKQENVVKDEKMKRITSERFDFRLKKMSEQEHVIVSKKKSTQLQNHALDVKNTKKFTMASSSTSRLSQNKVSLPSNLNSPYNSNTTHNLKPATVSSAVNGCYFSDLSGGGGFERYIGRRLLTTAYMAEAEEIVMEIEREIMENLLHEIAPATVAPEVLTG